MSCDGGTLRRPSTIFRNSFLKLFNVEGGGEEVEKGSSGRHCCCIAKEIALF
jgi:hypothetical protein